MMKRCAATLPRRSTYVPGLNPMLMLMLMMLGLSAAALDAAAAEPIHGWGLVDWGMTEAQVESAYGEGVAKLPPTRNRRTEIVESLHLKTPVVINGVSMAQSFAFSRADMRLERVVLRANLSNVSSAQCQGSYQRIRQAEVDQLKAPVEEKPTLRSVHAIWHGTAADAQLTIMEVTGRCLLTLVFKRPSPPDLPSDGTADTQADKRSTTAPATTAP